MNQTNLKISRIEATSLIEKQIADGQELSKKEILNTEELKGIQKSYEIWFDYNIKLLEHIADTKELRDKFDQRKIKGYSWNPFYDSPSLEQLNKSLHDDIDYYLTRLESIKNMLNLFPEKIQNNQNPISPPINKRHLKEKFRKYFDKADLSELCYDLNIDKQELTYSNKIEMIQEIISNFERNNLMPKLIDYCESKRPHEKWP